MFRRLFGSKDPEPERPPEPTGSSTDVDPGDRMVIEQLRQGGADMTRPREVRHYLYLPTERAANDAAEELRRSGYRSEVRPAAGPPGPNPWLVLATIEQVVDGDAIGPARRLFTRLATDAGGEYDGWEAAATP